MGGKILTAVLIICLGLCGCGKSAADGEAKTAFTINGEAVSLKEWNFYVRMNQMQWEKANLESLGDDMWSIEVEEDKTTMADALKEEVMEIICRIHLANQHAEEYAVALDEDRLQETKQRAEEFMGAYNKELLAFAGADESYVFDRLCEKELSLLVEEAATASYEPDIPEEDIVREGICYVLISTTGVRDDDGTVTPFTEEELKEKEEQARRLCEEARASGDLEAAADAEGLMPVVSSMSMKEGLDTKDPVMLKEARALKVGEISDVIRSEDGWFLVQHTSSYDEEGTEFWREYLTDQARGEEYERIYEGWKSSARIEPDQEVMDEVDVKIVLKELL